MLLCPLQTHTSPKRTSSREMPSPPVGVTADIVYGPPALIGGSCILQRQ